MAEVILCKRGHDTSIAGIGKWGCRMCNREATKRKRLNNLENYRKREREAYYKSPLYRNRSWKKYGIVNLDGTPFTTLDYDRAYQIQQRCCAICEKHQSQLTKRLHAEHNHHTGYFRSLVCNGCNIKIGSIESCDLKKILTYLNLEVH